MAQFDGIGRIYRTDLNPKVDRSPQTDPTERDRKRRDKEEKQEEEPHDTVELHDDELEIDIKGHKKAQEIVDLDEDGLDISA